jgi:acyl-coenzyme A thioesterase PaaI-like protein
MIMTLKNWWRRLARLPLGKWLFSKAIGLLIPYTNTISPLVLELSPGYAKVLIKDRRALRNHLRSLHAIALANVGEFSTGLALHCALNNDQRAILTNLTIDYHKKARGPIIAVARLKNTHTLVGPIAVDAQLFDEKDILVCSIKATWLSS